MENASPFSPAHRIVRHAAEARQMAAMSAMDFFIRLLLSEVIHDAERDPERGEFL